jgi:hypothetical protein
MELLSQLLNLSSLKFVFGKINFEIMFCIRNPNGDDFIYLLSYLMTLLACQPIQH